MIWTLGMGQPTVLNWATNQQRAATEHPESQLNIAASLNDLVPDMELGGAPLNRVS